MTCPVLGFNVSKLNFSKLQKDYQRLRGLSKYRNVWRKGSIP